MSEIKLFFSVVIPLYNKEKFIKRAINSVLSQTIKTFELIIVDDGSTDESSKIVQTYKDERVQLISKKNAGVSAARNTGILNSKAKFIAFLDADDEWLPDYLETVSSLISDFPLAGAYATSEFREDEKGNLTQLTYTTLPPHPWQGEIENLFHVMANDPLPVTASSVCIKKSIFEDVGMFPERIKRSEDIDTWIRIFLKYPIILSTSAKIIRHKDIDGGSITLAGNTEENLYALLELEKKIKANEINSKYINDAKRMISRLLCWEIDNCIKNKRYSLAFKYILDNRTAKMPMQRSRLLGKLLIKALSK